MGAPRDLPEAELGAVGYVATLCVTASLAVAGMLVLVRPWELDRAFILPFAAAFPLAVLSLHRAEGHFMRRSDLRSSLRETPLSAVALAVIWTLWLLATSLLYAAAATLAGLI